VFQVIQPANLAPVSSTKRTLITSFIVVANLIQVCLIGPVHAPEPFLTGLQFCSAMTTIGAGLFLSKLLGRGSSPGQANWMAASYS
jgi:hypothetical protein